MTERTRGSPTSAASVGFKFHQRRQSTKSHPASHQHHIQEKVTTLGTLRPVTPYPLGSQDWLHHHHSSSTTFHEITSGEGHGSIEKTLLVLIGQGSLAPSVDFNGNMAIKMAFWEVESRELLRRKVHEVTTMKYLMASIGEKPPDLTRKVRYCGSRVTDDMYKVGGIAGADT